MRIATLLLSCLLLVSTNASAQDSTNRRLVYANLKGYFSTPYGGNLSVATIIGRHHEIGIGYEIYFQKAHIAPPDWTCWSCKHGPVKDFMQGGTLTYGYVFYPGFLKSFARVVLRAGVLTGMESIPSGFTKIPNAKTFDDNYTYTLDQHFTTALLISPSVDLALGRYAGITIGPYGIVSNNFTGAGISFGAMLGRVANLKPYEKRPSPKSEDQAGKQ